MGMRLRAWLDQEKEKLPAAVEMLAVAILISLTVAIRIGVETLVGGVAPFALTFPATIAATLLLGARAGIVTAVGCQGLTMLFVLPHWIGPGAGLAAEIASVVLTGISLAAVVWAAAAYRRTSRQLRAQCTREVLTLSLLLREMDHRTKNNLQIVGGLLWRNARQAGNEVATRDLEQAAAQLDTIAAIYHHLALEDDAGDTIILGDYLRDVVELLREGLVPSTIQLSLATEHLQVASHATMMIGLIVNEWVTNAVKYAFPTGGGQVRIEAKRVGNSILITVRDDGCGTLPAPASGTGSTLVEGLAKAISAEVSIQRANGTACMLTFPLG